MGMRRFLQRLDVGEGVAYPVELSLVVEGGGARPHGAHDIEELVGALVAGVLFGPVAVPRQVGVAAAGDDVEGDAAAGEVVVGDSGTGGDGGSEEAGTVGHQHVQALGAGRRMRGDGPGVRPGRVVADEDAVEPGVLVGAGEIAHEGGIDGRLDGLRHGAIDLRQVVGADHADELDRVSVRDGLVRSFVHAAHDTSSSPRRWLSPIIAEGAGSVDGLSRPPRVIRPPARSIRRCCDAASPTNQRRLYLSPGMDPITCIGSLLKGREQSPKRHRPMARTRLRRCDE